MIHGMNFALANKWKVGNLLAPDRDGRDLASRRREEQLAIAFPSGMSPRSNNENNNRKKEK